MTHQPITAAELIACAALLTAAASFAVAQCANLHKAIRMNRDFIARLDAATPPPPPKAPEPGPAALESLAALGQAVELLTLEARDPKAARSLISDWEEGRNSGA